MYGRGSFQSLLSFVGSVECADINVCWEISYVVSDAERNGLAHLLKRKSKFGG